MEYNTISNKQEQALNLTVHQHSDRIVSRRKALFPSVSDDSSDLGPMSPLSDTNSNHSDSIYDKNEDHVRSFKDYFSSFRKNINNYVMIDDCSESNLVEEAINAETLIDKHTACVSPTNRLNGMTEDPASKDSPSKNLKTPNDSFTSNCSVKIPKLVRKHNGEFMHDIETGKHNFSPTTSPCSKAQKLDSGICKMSKVRTALFPDISLPVHSFYPKTDQVKVDKPHKALNPKEGKSKTKSLVTYLCSRRPSNRNRFGQINAGVRHRVRKPKQRRAPIDSKKAAMSIIECSNLVEFIKDLNNLTQAKPKLITILNNEKKSPENKSNKDENNILSADSASMDVNKKRIKCGSVKTVLACNGNFKHELVKDTNNQSNNTINDKIILDPLDFMNDTEEGISVPKLDQIFDILGDDEQPEEILSYSGSNQIILTASNTISDSENSILFHHPHNQLKFNNCKERKRKLENKENESADVLLSPTSQMCDMASGLAINSPKRARLNITSIIENNQGPVKNINVFNQVSSNIEMEKQKLFPVFYPSCNAQNTDVTSKTSNTKMTGVKKWKAIPEDQMLLDAGQKRFGFTQCPECEIVYHMGDPSEEIMHENYHNARSIFSFKGWKNENVVGILPDARIIKVSPGDSKIWLKKVKDVADVINRDLGYYELEFNIDNSFVFLYIKNKTIIGCLIAEMKSEAFKMLTSFDGIDVCSNETYPIKCGVSRIWVSQANRQKGIGTALMECLRTNFCYGYVLRRDEIALSSPSEFGKMFAQKYFQTENFLIYTS